MDNEHAHLPGETTDGKLPPGIAAMTPDDIITSIRENEQLVSDWCDETENFKRFCRDTEIDVTDPDVQKAMIAITGLATYFTAGIRNDPTDPMTSEEAVNMVLQMLLVGAVMANPVTSAERDDMTPAQERDAALRLIDRLDLGLDEMLSGEPALVDGDGEYVTTLEDPFEIAVMRKVVGK